MKRSDAKEHEGRQEYVLPHGFHQRQPLVVMGDNELDLCADLLLFEGGW